MKEELSKQDVEILKILQRDASKTSTEIAEAVNMSQSPCWRRINRVEKAGIVQRRVALLDRNKLGMELVAFTTVTLSRQGRQQMQEFEDIVSGFEEVVECYTMTGAWDYMLKIIVRNISAYEYFVRNKLLDLPMIGEVHSHIAVTEIKNTTELPLYTQL